jgi:hypothetical protein
MTRRFRCRSIAVTSIVALAMFVVEPGTGLARTEMKTTQDGSPCPAQALRLPSDGVARAAAAVVSQLRSDGDVKRTTRVVVTSAAQSAYAGVRGSEVSAQCGARAAARTVVVQLLYPQTLPSASASQGVVFMSRFASGYRIWDVAH